MKRKSVLSFFLLSVCLLFSSCSLQEKGTVENVITNDLDQLKDLKADVITQYVSVDALFQDLSDETLDSAILENFISCYFQDFNYKILDIDVKNDQATANIRLNTLDAQSLAKDFTKEKLKQDILNVANEDTEGNSLNEHFQLLTDLIASNNYAITETNCTMHLQKYNDNWIIEKDKALENEIIGKFISSLSNPNLLTPSETLDVYLSTIEQMDGQQLAGYLEITGFLNTDDPAEDELSDSIIQQLISHFTYQLGSVTQNGYSATVDTQITTFDSDAILKDYEKKLADYLNTPQALYDGPEGRLNETYALMNECIQSNTASTTLEIPVVMVNNGNSWTLENPETIGNALFGSVITSLHDNSVDSDSDSSYNDYQDSDFDSSDE